MRVGAQKPDMLEAGACGCRSPEARLSLEAGACVLVPRGQTCWRLACVEVQRPDMLEAGACVRWCPEDNQTTRQTNRQTDRQRDRETDRQTDGQTGRPSPGNSAAVLSIGFRGAWIREPASSAVV